MRKYFLIIAVFGIFVIYSLGIRHQLPVIKKPVAITSASSSPSTSTASSSTPSSTATTTATSSSSTSSSSNTTTGQYKDGKYTGSVADAYYGNVQVSVTISGGQITAVKFLQYPNTHSTSVYINQQAMPYLQQEAIHAQNAKVQLISGATFTSQAFIQSLNNALSQA